MFRLPEITFPLLISKLIILLIAFPIHELAHAIIADRLGDPTPRRAGRVTLNPLAHLDLFGSLLLLMANFGWAKPVPVSPYNLRPGPQLGMTIVAAAGPLSNLLLAVLGAVPFRLGLVAFGDGIASEILALFVLINIYLMLFNLIPVTPLDGSKILAGLAPREWSRLLFTLEQYGPIILLAMFFLGVIGLLINPPASFLFQSLLGL